MFHERQRAFAEELFVAGVEVVVVEEMGCPCCSGYPHAASKVFGEGVVVTVGGGARWQHDAAGTVEVLRVELHVGDQRFDVADVGEHEFGGVTHQHAGDGGRDVAVVGVVAGPAGNVGAAPDSLQIRR